MGVVPLGLCVPVADEPPLRIRVPHVPYLLEPSRLTDSRGALELLLLLLRLLLLHPIVLVLMLPLPGGGVGGGARGGNTAGGWSLGRARAVPQFMRARVYAPLTAERGGQGAPGHGARARCRINLHQGVRARQM